MRRIIRNVVGFLMAVMLLLAFVACITYADDDYVERYSQVGEVSAESR